MAGAERLELPTPGFGDLVLYQLNYAPKIFLPLSLLFEQA